MSSTKLITNEYQIDRLKVNHYLVFNFVCVAIIMIFKFLFLFVSARWSLVKLLIQEMKRRVIIHFVVTDVK
ncbi:hypothetical protein AS132_19780 [Photobacterium sanguinicancri]|uniref:Uncharacterized protein n=1 Tax=Photobacterium sanguinicancri TaxID=875932 RepID=A0ABX4G2Q6_9GAMM|nr:hypothetical protein AS132_19780 [Photobacterium sanguinicancri]OZS45424.1 hypothetical protein ASV53_03290 [Photobacterium sanguinicancri]